MQRTVLMLLVCYLLVLLVLVVLVVMVLLLVSGHCTPSYYTSKCPVCPLSLRRGCPSVATLAHYTWRNYRAGKVKEDSEMKERRERRDLVMSPET